MDLPLPPDFKEFLRLLDSEKIEYLLVGGYAVSFHGYPRPTGDLDVWVAIDPANISKLLAALGKFGFASAGANPGLFQPGQIIRMGVPPVRVELLCSVSGVEFAACAARSIATTIDGVPARVISRQDLIINKRAAG